MLRKAITLMGCIGLALAMTACRKNDGSEGGDGKKPKIAVIPKGETHVFWQTVKDGAMKAGKEFDVEVKWKGPMKENDRAQQIQVVKDYINQGVSGICLAPLDEEALLGPVKAANGNGIPVVIFDSSINGKAGTDFATFVATDNRQGGKLAGESLVKLLGDKKNVVMMRYAPGQGSTTKREAGFLEAASELNVLSKDQYAGVTIETAKTKALNMIDTLKKADGIFTPNESTTMGMLLALRSEGLAGKVKFVGFDASKPLVNALKKGEIDALVVQDPAKMGYLAVKSMVQHLRNEKLETYIDTGVAVITKANMDDPEIKPLLP